MSGLFLEEAEVAILMGIKIGRGGLSRSQRQIAALRTMGIPFHVNAVGRPIVARSLFETPSPAGARAPTLGIERAAVSVRCAQSLGQGAEMTEAAAILLSRPELETLTGYKTPTRQLQVLRWRGFHRAYIGRHGLILERVHYETVVGERAVVASGTKKAANLSFMKKSVARKVPELPHDVLEAPPDLAFVDLIGSQSPGIFPQALRKACEQLRPQRGSWGMKSCASCGRNRKKTRAQLSKRPVSSGTPARFRRGFMSGVLRCPAVLHRTSTAAATARPWSRCCRRRLR